MVGADFCFGKGRLGTAAIFRTSAKETGLWRHHRAAAVHQRRQSVSSTAIRAALTEGRPRDAAAMLGHWHRIEGEVIRGDQRGRDLGYPTANMSIDGLHPPAFWRLCRAGRRADGPHKGQLPGVASHGRAADVRENTANLETFLFDFKGDLYGAHLSVALVEYLRPEEKFEQP